MFRHSHFGGTYVVQNMKAIGENQLICHKPYQKIEALNFAQDKVIITAINSDIKSDFINDFFPSLSFLFWEVWEGGDSLFQIKEMNHQTKKRFYSINLWFLTVVLVMSRKGGWVDLNENTVVN